MSSFIIGNSLLDIGYSVPSGYFTAQLGLNCVNGYGE